MEKNQYLDILKKAFFISWKNKFLWFFGVLILIGTVISNLNINSDMVINKDINQLLIDLTKNDQKIIFIISIILFLFWIVIFLLKIMAATGIIKSINNLALYRQLSIKAILIETKNYLSRLVLLEIMIGMAMLATLLILAMPVLYLFAIKAQPFAIIALICAISIALPILVTAYYLNKYAGYNIILANEKIRTSLEFAYAIFSKNIKESLIMGVISFVFTLLATAIASLAMLVVITIYSSFKMALYLMFVKIIANFLILAIIIAIIVVVAAFFSWYLVFLYTSWFLFFQEIAFKKAKNEEMKTVILKDEMENAEVEIS